LITKVLEIGRLFSHAEDYRNFAQDVNVEKGIVVVLKAPPEAQLMEVRVEEKPKDHALLLYVQQAGNVQGKSPTVLLKKEDTIEKSVEKSLKKFSAFLEDEDLEEIKKVYMENEGTIREQIESKAKEIFSEKKTKAVFITFRIVQDEEELLPAQYEPFRKVFVKRMYEKFENAEKGVCALCGQEKAVSATANEAFKFTTFDKPGFCPNLDKRQAVKVFPVCDECLEHLKNGSNILQKDLSFKFFDLTLWVIPSLLQRDDKVLYRIVEKVRDSSRELKDFVQNERSVEKKLADVENTVVYDFLFMRIKQSQQKIELHLTEIPPTRLRTIVEKSSSVKARIGIDFEPNLKNLFVLYSKGSGKEVGMKDYLSLIRCVFQAEEYSPHRFLWYCMRTIRKALCEDLREFSRMVLLSFAHHIFLYEIGVFRVKLEERRCQNLDVFEEFFERYPEFFNEPWKKAVFLTGVLTGKLLAVQHAKRNSAPFFKKLKGLRMNYQDIQGLVPEIRNKFEQYRSYGKKIDELIKAAGFYYMQSPTCKATVDELNFVFSLGMTFASEEPFKQVQASDEGGVSDEPALQEQV